jgi:translation initiation factor 3 subunit D
MWGVFKSIAEMCLKLNDGKYLLVKDPNKPILRTYEVPADSFNDDYAKEPLDGPM